MSQQIEAIKSVLNHPFSYGVAGLLNGATYELKREQRSGALRYYLNLCRLSRPEDSQWHGICGMATYLTGQALSQIPGIRQMDIGTESFLFRVPGSELYSDHIRTTYTTAEGQKLPVDPCIFFRNIFPEVGSKPAGTIQSLHQQNEGLINAPGLTWENTDNFLALSEWKDASAFRNLLQFSVGYSGSLVYPIIRLRHYLQDTEGKLQPQCLGAATRVDLERIGKGENVMLQQDNIRLIAGGDTAAVLQDPELPQIFSNAMNRIAGVLVDSFLDRKDF